MYSFIKGKALEINNPVYSPTYKIFQQKHALFVILAIKKKVCFRKLESATDCDGVNPPPPAMMLVFCSFAHVMVTIPDSAFTCTCIFSLSLPLPLCSLSIFMLVSLCHFLFLRVSFLYFIVVLLLVLVSFVTVCPSPFTPLCVLLSVS